VEIGNAHWTR